MNKQKSFKRSFVLPADAMDKLRQIQMKQALDNPSQALIFAIQFCHEKLFSTQNQAEPSELISLIKRVLVIEKFILREQAISHGGKLSLTEESKAYLSQLNTEIKDYLKTKVDFFNE